MYVWNEEEINPLIQNHSQIPLPKQISRSFFFPKQISRSFFFRLKYFLGMFSSLSLSFLSIAIVNITLFVLIFFNLPQGDILTRAEKHFEELKDSFLPLPSWYQDELNKQWKSGELIFQGKGYACISPDGSNKLTQLPLRKIRPKGSPSL